MADSAMSYQKQSMRGAILIGISIWLGANALAQLDGIGVPDHAVRPLLTAGLVVVVALIAWPWARRRLPKTKDEPDVAARPRWKLHEALVTAEIVSLSALLIYLSVWMPE